VTCIVAVETRRGVWLGADSAGSNGYTIGPVESPKLFHNGPALFGICGSFRMGQILRYGLRVPTESLGWDVDRWIATDFAKALRKAYAEHGWDFVEAGVAEQGNFLVSVAGRCYEIQSDYSFLRSPVGEYAIGSGTYHALGSLHATRDYARPKDRLLASLEAAAEHVMSVAAPFVVMRHREAAA
jgi:ATP-dependent protease HslVU (ClpYQ) peptidase subunit